MLSFAYSYNPTSNITRIQSPDQEIKYQYDPLQRLTKVIENSKEKEQYKYDPVHNRIASFNENYLYDDNNRLLDIGDKIRQDYDLQGNLIAKRLNEQVISSYSYDVDNRLTEIETGESRIHYSYDPFGRRISKEVDGKKTFFHYADEGLVAELDDQGKIIRSYSWRPGSAWSTNPLVLLEGGKNPYFYYNNHLGAPVKLTDKEGKAVWAATYSAFGKAEITLAKVTNNLRLPGQYFDKETGLHYNFQRYYDPDTGRYITADPIGLNGGINLYAYVEGNPVSWIDPWGLDILVIHNGATDGNPFGHTAIAVENQGVYSPGNAGDLSPNFNNNIIGGSLIEYVRRESTRRDTRFTLIETTSEQDQEILEILKKQTSQSGYIDNCATRIGTVLDVLYDDLTFMQKLYVGYNGILPISVEWRAGRLMDILGGKKYKQDRVKSQSDADKLVLNSELKKFESTK